MYLIIKRRSFSHTYIITQNQNMQINLRIAIYCVSCIFLPASAKKISFIKLGKVFLCEEEIRVESGLTVQIALSEKLDVASAPLFAIIPRLFVSRTRALVSLVLNSDRRAASPLSLVVPLSLR